MNDGSNRKKMPKQKALKKKADRERKRTANYSSARKIDIWRPDVKFDETHGAPKFIELIKRKINELDYDSNLLFPPRVKNSTKRRRQSSQHSYLRRQR